MVLVGYGRVGSRIGEDLQREKVPFLVVEDHHELVNKLRARGIEAIHGNAAAPEVIDAANLAEAVASWSRSRTGSRPARSSSRDER